VTSQNLRVVTFRRGLAETTSSFTTPRRFDQRTEDVVKPAADAEPSPSRWRSKHRGARLGMPMLLPLALILAFALGCGAGPTQPSPQNVHPTPTPTRTPPPPPPPPPTPPPTPPPAPLDLNGEWSGTFVGELCANPVPIRIRLSHVAGRVRGSFNMNCFGACCSIVVLDGSLSGSTSGPPPGYFWLEVNDQHACLLHSAGVTSTRITLSSRSSNLCVGARLSLTR
jgi:hypothetical protein